MILGRILEYLGEHEAAGVGELARALGSAPDAVRGMLDTLQRRGLVHALGPVAACGAGCRQCGQADGERYARGPAPSTGTGRGCQVVTWR